MTRSQFAFVPGPFALLVGFSLFWFSDSIADPDLWGHIRFGQDIRRTGSIVRIDVYSYRTGEQRWINHEWLSEVIFAGLYDQAGQAGLVVSKVLVGLMILGLMFAHLRRVGLGPYCSVVLLVVISIPFRLGLGTIRPQVFTYFFFLLELFLLQNAGSGRGYSLWAVPILVALWVNLHGGVLAGAGLLLLWVTIRIAAAPRDESSGLASRLGLAVRLVPIGVACCLALLLNPYGSDLVAFLLRTATVPRPEIREWAALSLASLPGLLYLVLLAIGIAGLAASGRRRRPETIVIFSVASLLPLIANRHYPLFALTLVVLGGEHIADAWNRWRPPSWAQFGRVRWITSVSVLVSLGLVALSVPRFGCIRVEPFYFPFPARAVALLRQSGVSGNMAVPFDWGEYVLWHLGPRVKVSIDGRRETVYSDEMYRQYRDFEQGTGVWDAFLKTSKTDFILAPNGSAIANLLSGTAGWVPLYQDTFCLVFVRAGLTDIARITKIEIPALPDNGGGLCFPAPAQTRHEAAAPNFVK